MLTLAFVEQQAVGSIWSHFLRRKLNALRKMIMYLIHLPPMGKVMSTKIWTIRALQQTLLQPAPTYATSRLILQKSRKMVLHATATSRPRRPQSFHYAFPTHTVVTSQNTHTKCIKGKFRDWIQQLLATVVSRITPRGVICLSFKELVPFPLFALLNIRT